MKCRNDVFMSKVGVNKLDKAQEVHFDVQRDLPDCKKINTKNYLTTDAATPSFNKFKTPANQFECMRVLRCDRVRSRRYHILCNATCQRCFGQRKTR